MQKAMQLLQQRDKKLIDFARLVGYESDAAFSKAFKRVVGTNLVNTANMEVESMLTHQSRSPQPKRLCCNRAHGQPGPPTAELN